MIILKSISNQQSDFGQRRRSATNSRTGVLPKNERLERERWEREEEERRRREEEARRKLEEQRKQYEKELEEAKKIIGNPDNVPVKKVSARQHIDSINDVQKLRDILDKLINLGYEYILDQIINEENSNA